MPARCRGTAPDLLPYAEGGCGSAVLLLRRRRWSAFSMASISGQPAGDIQDVQRSLISVEVFQPDRVTEHSMASIEIQSQALMIRIVATD